MQLPRISFRLPPGNCKLHQVVLKTGSRARALGHKSRLTIITSSTLSQLKMIQLSEAGKRFGPHTLFEDLNWLITPKERVGIVVANDALRGVGGLGLTRCIPVARSGGHREAACDRITGPNRSDSASSEPARFPLQSGPEWFASRDRRPRLVHW